MHRFTDIERTVKRLPHTYGYQTVPLLPLQQALASQLLKVRELQSSIQAALRECHFPSEHGLTRDESAAIYLYTMEFGNHGIYQPLNRALRSENRNFVTDWFSYLKLFDTAVRKLPNVSRNLWRGISKDIKKNYKEGETITWWGISSCSHSLEVVKGFLSRTTTSTLFLIEAVHGKDMWKYSSTGCSVYFETK